MNLQKICHRNGNPAAAPRAVGPLALLAMAGSLVTVLGMGGCAVEREPNYEFLPWLNSMFFSSAAEPYALAPVNAKTGKPVFANGRVAQLPPAGTLPRGFAPLHFSNDDAGRETAGFELKQPFEATPENLARGAWGFATFCVPCHAGNGGGAGPVALKAGWNFPIGFADNVAARMPDGMVFHILSYGRGNMPSYASQVSQADRWKILLHLRQLQQQNGATPAAAPAPAAAPSPAAAPAAVTPAATGG